MNTIDQEADRIATREYLGHGVFGGISKASGGIIVSKKLWDFESAKRRAITYLKSINFGLEVRK